MIIYFIFCVVLQTSFCYNAKTTYKMAAATTVKPKMDRNIYKKTAELIYLINKIYNNDYEDKFKEAEMDYFSTRDSREMALKQVMKLIQKTYDANKLNIETPIVRVHIISNPEVLDQFKNVLKENELSSYEDESDGTKKLKDILKNLRRQAVFRLDDPESIEEIVPDEEGNPEGHYSKEKPFYVEINSRKNEVTSKEDNTWDIITKKYDWNDDNRDAKDQKDWRGKGSNISEDDKKKDDKLDDWGKKKDTWDDIGQDKSKSDNKLDDWAMRDKKNIDVGKKKTAHKLDVWGQKDDKKRNKWDDIGKDKNKDSWDDWGQKKETLKTWGDINKPKQKKDKVDNWDPPKIWKGSDTKEKKQNEWNKKDDWDNWKATTRQKRKTTKRKSQAGFKKINEWDHYLPQVQNKRKRHEFERNIPPGAFARTSIPFVGKKGIYEE